MEIEFCVSARASSTLDDVRDRVRAYGGDRFLLSIDSEDGGLISGHIRNTRRLQVLRARQNGDGHRPPEADLPAVVAWGINATDRCEALIWAEGIRFDTDGSMIEFSTTGRCDTSEEETFRGLFSALAAEIVTALGIH